MHIKTEDARLYCRASSLFYYPAETKQIQEIFFLLNRGKKKSIHLPLLKRIENVEYFPKNKMKQKNKKHAFKNRNDISLIFLIYI
jgi:ferredoxin-fold anticodon binding domain-containing protein